jgi:hypothetical protein
MIDTYLASAATRTSGVLGERGIERAAASADSRKPVHYRQHGPDRNGRQRPKLNGVGPAERNATHAFQFTAPYQRRPV